MKHRDSFTLQDGRPWQTQRPGHFLQYKALGDFPHQPFYLPHQPFGNC